MNIWMKCFEVRVMNGHYLFQKLCLPLAWLESQRSRALPYRPHLVVSTAGRAEFKNTIPAAHHTALETAASRRSGQISKKHRGGCQSRWRYLTILLAVTSHRKETHKWDVHTTVCSICSKQKFVRGVSSNLSIKLEKEQAAAYPTWVLQ